MKLIGAFAIVLAVSVSLVTAQTPAVVKNNAVPPPRVPVKWLAEAIELAGPPPADTPRQLQVKAGDRIMAIGDMITDDGGWMYAVNQVLAPYGATFTVVPARGINNNGEHPSTNHLILLQESILPRKPTIVAINVGVFELWLRRQVPAEADLIAVYRRNVGAMVDVSHAAGARVILLAPTIRNENPGDGDNLLIQKLAAAMGEVAREKQCAFVDLHAMFRTALAKKKPTDPKHSWLTRLGVRMNVRGSALMAVGLLRAFGVPDEKSAAVAYNWPVKPAPADEILEAKTFVPADNADMVLRYRYGKPARMEEGKRYPLFLLLHGAGDRGEDNAKQVDPFFPLIPRLTAATPCYIVIPQVPSGEGWGNVWASYGWGTSSETMKEKPTPWVAMSKQVVDSLVVAEAVDPDRIYVTGLSMGGYGTWEMIQRWPDFFAAAIPICGGGDPALAKKLVNLPIWTWHGESDGVISVDKTRRMVDAMEAAGGKPKATYIPNGDHFAWVPAYKDNELLQWLLDQRRGGAGKKVSVNSEQ